MCLFIAISDHGHGILNVKIIYFALFLNGKMLTNFDSIKLEMTLF